MQHSPNGYEQRILHAIQICRTSALGGHVDACESCGHVSISYNDRGLVHLGYDPDLCPECRQGKMVVIQRLDAIRGPPEKP